MLSTRNYMVDNVRTFAIILVVLGHSIQYSLPGIFDDNLIFRLIYSFHMPLFMFISGYASFYSQKIDLLKRAKLLLIPFAFGSVVFYFTTYIETMNFGQYLQLLFDNPGVSYWFLYILFLCDTILYVCSKISKKYLGIIGLVFSILILQIHFSGEGLSNLKWYLFFFMLGRLVHEKRELLPQIKKSYLFFVGSLVLFLFLSHFWHRINPVEINFAGNFGRTVYRYLLPLSGIAMTFSLFGLFNNEFVNKIGQYVGQRTLDIYVLNVYMISLCLMVSHWIPFVFPVSFAACLLGSYVLRKIPIVRLLVFGK